MLYTVGLVVFLSLLQVISSSAILVVIALIIIIGYIASAIFRRTRVPELLILMLIGIFLVQIADIIPVNYLGVLRSLAPLFSSLALIVIMFNGSKELNVSDPALRNWKGIALGFLDVFISIVVVASFVHYVPWLQWPWIYGIILGTILGETTNIVVIPFIRKVKLSKEMFGAMFTETALNSLVAIVVFSLLLLFVTHQVVTPISFASYVLDYLSFAIVMGLIASIAWLFVSNVLTIAREYVATLAVAILLYGFVTIFNGAAIISVLIFGVVIGNEALFREMYDKLVIKKQNNNENEQEKADSKDDAKKLKNSNPVGLMEVQKELEFLISTFFFVFMGMITILSEQFLVYGLAIAALLIVSRYVEVRTVLFKNSPGDRRLAFALLPRGLTVATLATIVYGMGGTYFMQTFYISFMVIVVTAIVSSLMLNRVQVEVKPQ